MAELKIASINCYTGIDKITNISLMENPSLSQYDIILFNISDIPENINSHIVDYWHQQLKSAYDNGRLIIIMMDTNYRLSQHSYASFNGSYWILPFAPSWKQTTIGTDIKHCISNNKPIVDFINQIKRLFDDDFYYSCIFNDDNSGLATILRNANKEPIGFLHQETQKCCLLIPQIKFHKIHGARKAIALGKETADTQPILDKIQNRFIGILIQLYKSLHNGDTYESEPEWISANDVYKTNEEIGYENNIRDNEVKIVEIDQENKKLKNKCLELGQLRYLLFANDKPLEDAVNLALQILGAESSEYNNPEHNLQIDNLIHYDGLTLIGEDKGHKGYANNDDINQLIGHPGAYYEAECQSSDDVPKAVLFINTERKADLSTRDKTKCCSEKTIKLSKAHKIPIVWTPDLFFIAKYVKDSKNNEFAKQCMDVIINSKGGVVDFPEIPEPVNA